MYGKLGHNRNTYLKWLAKGLLDDETCFTNQVKYFHVLTISFLFSNEIYI